LSVSRGRRRAGPCSTNRGADRSLGAVIRPEIDLAGALTTFRRELGIETLLLEGGAGINGSFLAAGLVDELSLVIAPGLDGGADAERIVAAGDGLKGKVTLSLLGCEHLAAGAVNLRYRVEAVG